MDMTRVIDHGCLFDSLFSEVMFGVDDVAGTSGTRAASVRAAGVQTPNKSAVHQTHACTSSLV